jgi:hypothetical protein
MKKLIPELFWWLRKTSMTRLTRLKQRPWSLVHVRQPKDRKVPQ